MSGSTGANRMNDAKPTHTNHMNGFEMSEAELRVN